MRLQIKGANVFKEYWNRYRKVIHIQIHVQKKLYGERKGVGKYRKKRSKKNEEGNACRVSCMHE